MKLTREQARRLEYERLKAIHKRRLQSCGEHLLYFSLKKANKDEKIFDMPITEYIEMLKEELKQENEQEDKNVQ